MGNLLATCGSGSSGRSLMLVTNAMNQPAATMPNPYGGEVRDGSMMTADELKAFCLEKGPAYSHPRFIDIVPALPLNGAGKVDRGIVQARLTVAHGAASAAANKA